MQLLFISEFKVMSNPAIVGTTLYYKVKTNIPILANSQFFNIIIVQRITDCKVWSKSIAL